MKPLADEQTQQEKTQAELIKLLVEGQAQLQAQLAQAQQQAQAQLQAQLAQAQQQAQLMKLLADKMEAMILTSKQPETADPPKFLGPLHASHFQTKRTPSPAQSTTSDS